MSEHGNNAHDRQRLSIHESTCALPSSKPLRAGVVVIKRCRAVLLVALYRYSLLHCRPETLRMPQFCWTWHCRCGFGTSWRVFMS